MVIFSIRILIIHFIPSQINSVISSSTIIIRLWSIHHPGNTPSFNKQKIQLRPSGHGYFFEKNDSINNEKNHLELTMVPEKV